RGTGTPAIRGWELVGAGGTPPRGGGPPIEGRAGRNAPGDPSARPTAGRARRVPARVPGGYVARGSGSGARGARGPAVEGTAAACPVSAPWSRTDLSRALRPGCWP